MRRERESDDQDDEAGQIRRKGRHGEVWFWSSRDGQVEGHVTDDRGTTAESRVERATIRYRSRRTLRTRSSGRGVAHPRSSPAMCPIAVGSANSSVPARTFLSDRATSTIWDGSSPEGGWLGSPARS